MVNDITLLKNKIFGEGALTRINPQPEFHSILTIQENFEVDSAVEINFSDSVNTVFYK